MKKGIEKKQLDLNSAIVNAICVYNVICFVVILCGKAAGSIPLMDTGVIAIAIPIVLYCSCKVLSYIVKVVMLINLLLTERMQKQIKVYGNKLSKAA